MLETNGCRFIYFFILKKYELKILINVYEKSRKTYLCNFKSVSKF